MGNGLRTVRLSGQVWQLLRHGHRHARSRRHLFTHGTIHPRVDDLDRLQRQLELAHDRLRHLLVVLLEHALHTLALLLERRPDVLPDGLEHERGECVYKGLHVRQ